VLSTVGQGDRHDLVLERSCRRGASGAAAGLGGERIERCPVEAQRDAISSAPIP